MHHSWENLGILSPLAIVRLDIVLHGFLSPLDFVPLGFCPPWILSHLDIFPLGFCPHWILSPWVFVLLGFCPLGYCPMGFCPVGFCPRTISTMGTYFITVHLIIMLTDFKNYKTVPLESVLKLKQEHRF